jgi:Cu/Ag efflux protein CusF
MHAMKTPQLWIARNSELATSVHIEEALEAIPGVSSAKGDLQHRRVTVKHGEADPEQLRWPVMTSGMPAEVVA